MNGTHCVKKVVGIKRVKKGRIRRRRKRERDGKAVN